MALMLSALQAALPVICFYLCSFLASVTVLVLLACYMSPVGLTPTQPFLVVHKCLCSMCSSAVIPLQSRFHLWPLDTHLLLRDKGRIVTKKATIRPAFL